MHQNYTRDHPLSYLVQSVQYVTHVATQDLKKSHLWCLGLSETSDKTEAT